jgi:hypothetical protein
MRSRACGLTLVDFVVTVEVCLIALGFCCTLMPSFLMHGHTKAESTRCANNLKQIGLAAIQYSDDKRFFPHIAPRDQLDGGYTSNTAARVFRALVFYNYDDNPESFVCPSSPDQFVPLTQAAKTDLHAFRWDGAEAAAVSSASPLAPWGEDAHDKPLTQMTDLSYGWTRRSLSSNSPSTSLLAADKARLPEDGEKVAIAKVHADNMIGNHKTFVVAVCVDAHILRITPDGDVMNTRNIAAASDPKTDGFLGVLGDDPLLGQ